MKIFEFEIQKIRTSAINHPNQLHDSVINNVADFQKPKSIVNKTIAVLDTNIFLSHHESVKTISEKDAEKIVFAVPWVVIQELDNCKRRHNDYSANIGLRAQASIKFILSALESNSKAFMFENSAQV